MKKGGLLLVLSAAVFFLASVADVSGEAPAVGPQLVVQPAAPQEPAGMFHAMARIDMSNREHPLWLYKRVCVQEVVPQFIAEVKKESPDLDEKNLAERIVVQMDQPGDAIDIYIRSAAGCPPESRYAHKLATMAVRRFNALDQSERMKTAGRIAKQKAAAESTLKEQEERVRSLDRDLSRFKADAELWRTQLSSYTTQLGDAELKKAELETKLKLLSQKAAEVRNTVSSEDIGALEKLARELEMKIDDQSGEDLVEKCALVLQQKEQEFKRVTELGQSKIASQAEIQKAEFEFQMARREYVQARRIPEELKSRLARVKDDLAKARNKFAQTGGLGLATIIAEKTLESETELATIQGKIRTLQQRIHEPTRRLEEYRDLESERDGCRSANEELRKRLNVLLEQENELQGRVSAGIEISKFPDRRSQTGSFTDIAEERPGMYEVVGEVKKPGTIKLQPETTILKAIEAAGGFTPDADTQNVVVLRAVRGVPPFAVGDPQWASMKLIVDCKAIMDGKSPDDFIIEADDALIAPQKEPAK